MKENLNKKMYLISLFTISKAPMRLYLVMIASLLYLAGFNVILSYLLQNGLNLVMDKSGQLSMFSVGAMLCLSCVVYMIASYISPVYREKIFQYIAANLKKNLYERILDKPLLQDKEITSGDWLTRMIEDCDNCCHYITRTVFMAAQLVVNILFGVIYVCFFSWQIGVILLVIAPVFYHLNKKYANEMGAAFGQFQEGEGKHRNLFEEIYKNINVIKIFNMKRRLLDKDNELFNEKFIHAKTQAKQVGKMAFLTETGVMIVELGILVYGIFLVRGNLIEIGTLIGLWNAAVGSIVYPTTELPFILGDVAEQYTSWTRVSEYAIHKKNNKSESMQQNSDVHELKLDNLTFGYDENQLLFEKINLSFNKGQTSYIVGESGIGKSTLIKLMLSLYEPINGQVSIRTSDQVIEKEHLNQYISYVPQDNPIFAMSVYDNIAMGLESVTEEQVYKSAQMANIHNFILTLPEGYHTVIKDATSLSAGQAQRIAIARALIRNTPFVIMDEPFASLDQQNIDSLVETIDKMSETQGCIIVTHDKKSIRSSGKIVRIDGGGIYEQAI